MKAEIEKKINHLNKLLETAQNPKILLEEMQIISNNAFDLQEELMQLLNQIEETQTDINTIQDAFSTRETVWDLINKIALREKELIDSHASRKAFEEHQKNKRCSTKTKKSSCMSDECCCHTTKTDDCEQDECHHHTHKCTCCH